MLRFCLLLLLLPLASSAQQPVARMLPRQITVQVPLTPAVAAPTIQLLVCSVRCVFIRIPEPRVLPDQIWLRIWLGMPPDLR